MRVDGAGFRLGDCEFKVQILEYSVEGSGFRFGVSSIWYGSEVFGFRIQGLGLRM